MHYCHSRCINNENLTYFTNRQFDVSLGNSLCFYKDYIECHMKNNRHSELFETIGIVSLCKLNSQEPNDVKNDCKIILTEWPTATVKVHSLHCKKWENTVRRKFEYGVFQITNAKNLVKSRVEDEWIVRNFWHERFGKPHTPISDLTVFTLLKTTNSNKVRKNSWNYSKVVYTLYKVLSKTHVHTL